MNIKSNPILPVKQREVNVEMEKQFLLNGLPAIFSRLFASRGVNSVDECQTLGKKILPWSDMKGITQGVELLISTILAKKKIVIVADYDSDGATSCAIGYRALKSLGADVDFKVPNRFLHGYGLTPSVVQEVYSEKRPDLIITVDNGIASFDGIELCNQLGVKVLVTDHHLAADILPNAEVIVNPNQPGCVFGSKNLAGCGVIFYLMAALRETMVARKLVDPEALRILSLLDYVAIGTIADVVKLDLNNRRLARMGLERIRGGLAHPGVSALFTVARRSTSMATSKDIGFAIGPRINAAGRLDDMSIGIRCLISDDFQEALDLALQLDDLNVRRKEIENEMQEIAVDLLKEDFIQSKPFGICVHDESFHEGVIGIVAGRIKEREHRPVIAFAKAQEDGLLKGSGRSIPGFHLRDGLDIIYKKQPGVIKKFGGHAMAAGLTIDGNQLDLFKTEFNKICESLLNEEMLSRYVLVDGDIPAGEITLSLAEQLSKEVWGQGFSEPLFESVFTIKSQTLLKDVHLKMELEKDGYSFDAIWFFKGELMTSNQVSLVFSLEASEFKREKRVQLQIVQGYSLRIE